MFERSIQSLRAALTALRSAEGALLLVVILVGASVRGLYLREATEDPAFSHPAIDAGFDDYCARKMAVPNWVPPAHLPDPEIDKRPYLRPPGYPWFLAAIYAVSGGSYVAPRIVQMLLGLASALLAWRIGRRWFSPAVGLAWSAILVLYWSLVYWEGELHEVALLVFLLLASVEILGRWSESPRVGRAMAAGAILGIGALVRPNTLLLVPFVLVWMAWIARRRGARALPSGAGLLAAAALVIAPATIRNARVAGDPVLISTNFGINLFIGNNEKAAGFVSANLGNYGAFRNCYDYPAVARKVERELGRPLKDSEISAHFTGKALSFVRENPNRFLWLLMRKTILFWGPDEIPHNKVDALEREHSKVLRWLPGNFPLLLSGGLLGLFFAWRASSKKLGGELGSRREVIVLVLGFTVAWFLSVVPFFVSARYRAPILPFLMLFSAVAIHELVALALGRRLVAFAAWAAGFGLLFALASWSPIPIEQDVAKWHMDRGRAWSLSGKPELAIAEFEQTLAARPGASDAEFWLALSLNGVGRKDEAIEHYRLVSQADPNYASALGNLGSLMWERGQHEEAIELFERALRADPESSTLQYNLGWACQSTGRMDAAIAHYREAVRLSPRSAQAIQSLATALQARGDAAEAALLRRRLAELQRAR